MNTKVSVSTPASLESVSIDSSSQFHIHIRERRLTLTKPSAEVTVIQWICDNVLDCVLWTVCLLIIL